MKIISWNIGGINACTKKGLLDFIRSEGADVYCFQEVKSSPEAVNSTMVELGYHHFYLPAKKKGYSGVLVYTKLRPLAVVYGIGGDVDKEGRVLTLEYDDFFLVNVYFPHSTRELKRLNFKLDFNNLFLEFCKSLNGKPLVIAGDFNVAHKDIDLARPKDNRKNAGFTVKEREWFEKFLKQGYTDTFRLFTSESGHYTWWTYRNNCRERNIGWRIDYIIVSNDLKDRIKGSWILKNVYGSDHCPIGLDIRDKKE